MPSVTHRSAIARPIPLAAPVITAPLPLNFFIASSREVTDYFLNRAALTSFGSL